jgi:hypothetical protein
VDEREGKAVEPAAKPPRRMLVPVPLPEGTRWEGFFGPLGEQFDNDGREPTLEALGVQEAARQHTWRFGGFGGADFEAGVRFGRDGALLRPSPASQSQSLRRGIRTEELANGLREAARPTSGPATVRLWESKASAASSRASGQSGMSIAAAAESVRRLSLREAVPNFFAGKQAGIADLANVVDAESASRSYTALALAASSGGALETARQSLESARRARAGGNLDSARAAFERAYFIDSAAAAVGRSDHQIAAEAIGANKSLRSTGS